MKIEIRSRYDASVLFAADVGSWKIALEAAVKSPADLGGADLRDADLRGADLRDANLGGADLRGADLRDADLRDADLRGADLRDADLRGADLRDANLRGADLGGADLRDADLRGADLRDANLGGADLRDADLRDAKNLNAYRVTPLLMLMDQPGPIWAYKLVTGDGVGPFNGGITYAIGEEYSVSNANTDATLQCAAGINLATLDWCMREWRDGYRILIAEFVAADIAAIPTATDGKFRVRRCRIVGEKDLATIGLT
ncbi:MAG: pentapeptide repeat-containing protein [Deltaproteobacteria bacterium]|nr:pentapeptide repeat-containing protein [Deltaproteobacteria bacterium]